MGNSVNPFGEQISPYSHAALINVDINVIKNVATGNRKSKDDVMVIRKNCHANDSINAMQDIRNDFLRCRKIGLAIDHAIELAAIAE
jgi:hypothetical protein